jgi:site-specific DNA-adenine methylase|tara:strand:+ start:342 stop:572 length:231 start_codon:yes stop_codon:yes gene_type:complete
MTEEKKQMITIDDVEYAIEDLNENCINLINNIQKSNQLEADKTFEIEMLKASRQTMFDNLKAELPKQEKPADEQSD